MASTAVRRLRVFGTLGAVLVAGVAVGVVTGALAAWIVAAVALGLTVGYRVVVAHVRHVATEREMSLAFGPAPALDDLAWGELSLSGANARTTAAGVPSDLAAGESAAVVKYVVASLLAWILTPLVGTIRLVGGNATELDGGLVGRLVRLQQYGRSQSLKVLGASVVATAGVTAVGFAAPSALAGSRPSASAGTAAASGVHVSVSQSNPAGSSSTSSYTVQRGDTLAEIANQFGTSVSTLASVNHLSDPNLILIGQVLQVPVGPYTVQSGDTLANIAARYGSSVSELASSNGISNPNMILVGQQLRVSGGQLPAVTHPAATGTSVTTSSANATPAARTTPAKATARTTAATAPALVGSGTYTVQRGDTLANIAAKYDTTADTLMQANHLKDGNVILVGQVLQVGGRGANAPKADPKSDPAPRARTVSKVSSAPRPSAPPLVGSGTYTVQRGDTLARIADRFDTSVATLVQANHLRSGNSILVGQVLQVGGRGANAPKPDPKPAAPKPDPKPAPKPAPAPALVGSGTYTVQSGDTLSSIAVRFHTTVATLVQANHLSSDAIDAGQVLQV
ncbi:MAG TPA: LysM peptidoglycan-binding domain-containing protein, partial [Acidimicrobiales bacterium]|nr:LysM peptidoglycan-binding domain-containing protein [Acidimicrobiales bacterium]